MPSESLTTVAARILSEVLPLAPDDQVEVLALTIRAWCGMRDHGWSGSEKAIWEPMDASNHVASPAPETGES
jgi:hypothetical protein